ncbi:MAG TPA: GNAT family N-acetyltransferase [Solirubrobacterales bacterium]|nr:GNAT family N-acetyltransferase [Solirubrobacterales bacterium]
MLPRIESNSLDTILRAGTAADVGAALALWRRAETGPTTTGSVDDLLWLLERDPDALLLADAAGEVVGSLIIGWDGWRGTFYRLAVDPAHRRRGLATRMVWAGEERLRALGAQRLNAIVESEEADAMAFWASAGYELQTARSRFVKNLP